MGGILLIDLSSPLFNKAKGYTVLSRDLTGARTRSTRFRFEEEPTCMTLKHGF
jgi:hypothetical protein